MADITPIALAVKPVDVATPLLQAQRIRSMQMEEQQQRDAMVKQAAGDWARGVAVYADKPEFAQKWAEGLDQLHANGMMPTQAYQSIRNTPSPLMLQQIIAQTTDPRLAFQQKQADRSFSLQQQQFEESKRTSQRDFELRERELAAKRATEPWMPGPDGSLVPRQGGPADPSYQAKLDESKKETPDKIRILRAAGIDPTSPEGRQALFKLDEKLTPTDRKAIQNAEDENTILENTVEALKLAQDLNEKTFTGWTASMRGTIGTKMPGGGVLVDENAAKATQEWDKIMQSEAIQNMSKTLRRVN